MSIESIRQRLNAATPGPDLVAAWQEEDRRNFRGVFIPCGDNDAPCILPWHDGGNHEEG